MRILVVGAGAIGGYFGGRLLQAGRDVTFLVRARRAAELADDGLIVKSSYGDLKLAKPATVLSENISSTFDLIILSCKAYDLAGAIESFAPAVGPETVILPMLNGMKHLDILDSRFGASHVLGGYCAISATLSKERTVVHLNKAHTLAFGERDGAVTQRINAVAAVMADAGFDARLSKYIVQDMWDKWVLLATLAAASCLMRAHIGDIVAAPEGSNFIIKLLEECRAIAEIEGHAPRSSFIEQTRTTLTAAGSPMAASMLRDVEGHAQTEADHVIGDLLRRGGAGAGHGGVSLLQIAYSHLKAYQARRARESDPA